MVHPILGKEPKRFPHSENIGKIFNMLPCILYTHGEIFIPSLFNIVDIF